MRGIVALVMAVSAISAVSPQEIPHFKSGVDTVPHQRAVRLAPGVDGYDIGVRLPAGPGRYVVTIEVSDGRRTARREVPLRVR